MKLLFVTTFLIAVCPIASFAQNPTATPTRAQILALNRWHKNYAAQNDLVYLDYYSALVDDKGFLKADVANDGLHPNQKGYESMKPLADAAIKQALKQKVKK